MADDYAIFKNEFRPVNLAFLEEKIVCPHPSCEGKAVLFQKNGLQQHYRLRQPETSFQPKIEHAALVKMKKLHAKETRNVLDKLFETRSRQVSSSIHIYT